MTAGTDLRLLRAAVFTAVCVLLSAAGHATAAGSPLPVWSVGAAGALVFAGAAPLAGRERSLPGIAALLAAGQAALHVLFAAAHRGPATAGTGSGTEAGRLQELARTLLCNDAASHLTTGEARRVVADAGLSGEAAAATGGHAAAQATGHSAAAGGGAGTDGAPSVLDAALAQFSLPMLLGHLLAAAAVGWLLHRGETAVWRLVRLSAAPARAAEELLTVRALRAAVRLLRALLHGLTTGDGTAPPAAHTGHDRPGPPGETPLTGAVTRRGPPHTPNDLALAA